MDIQCQQFQWVMVIICSFTCCGCCSSCASRAGTLIGDFDVFFFLSGDAVVVDLFFSGDDVDATSFLSSAPCSIELQ
jgi:hypothetical protein